MSDQPAVKAEIAGWNPLRYGQDPGKHVESRIYEFTKGNQRWRQFQLFVPFQSKKPDSYGQWVPGRSLNAKPQTFQELVQRINEVIATVCPEMGGQFVFQPGPMAPALPPMGAGHMPQAPQQGYLQQPAPGSYPQQGYPQQGYPQQPMQQPPAPAPQNYQQGYPQQAQQAPQQPQAQSGGGYQFPPQGAPNFPQGGGNGY